MNELRKLKIVDDIDAAVTSINEGFPQAAIANALIAIARMMAHDRDVFGEGDDEPK